METKLFELRDRGTFIPIIATLMCSDDPAEVYLLRRTGYSGECPKKSLLPFLHPLILLDRLTGGCSDCDPHSEHGGGKRTFPTAHQYIQDHWSELVSGQVIDVEFILGETDHPKVSEAVNSLTIEEETERQELRTKSEARFQAGEVWVEFRDGK